MERLEILTIRESQACGTIRMLIPADCLLSNRLLKVTVSRTMLHHLLRARLICFACKTQSLYQKTQLFDVRRNPYERIPYFQEIHNTDVHNDNLHSWRTGRYNPVFPDHAGRNIRRSRLFNGRRHRYSLRRSHADLWKPCLANTLRILGRAIQDL